MSLIRKEHRQEVAFEIITHLGGVVIVTKSYWNIITHVKHPSVKGKEAQVKDTLMSPDEIRRSKKDRDAYLFYRKYENKFLCIVAKVQQKEGFIITAYYTEKIKEGELKWKR